MRGLIGAMAAIMLLLSAFVYQTAFSAPRFNATVAGSTVKVISGIGHGSGIHIGDGYILTAAHVVGANTDVRLKGDDGRMTDAEVLWINTRRDIALLKTNADLFAMSNLSCEDEPVGSMIYARGNPLNMEFVNMWGRIAGIAREVGPWQSAYIADMTILPGMSGGGIFNSKGEVIGLAVGVAIGRVGFGASMTGMGYIAPSSEVCNLLGR